MTLRRVAADELCKDGYTCHGVWVDDDPDIEDVVVVGDDLDPSPVPLGSGEQIYLTDRDAHPSLESLREDFWLVDEATAVRMIYDSQGRFDRPELAEDVRPYVLMRDTAFRHAEPLDEYVARRGLEFTA